MKLFQASSGCWRESSEHFFRHRFRSNNLNCTPRFNSHKESSSFGRQCRTYVRISRIEKERDVPIRVLLACCIPGGKINIVSGQDSCPILHGWGKIGKRGLKLRSFWRASPHVPFLLWESKPQRLETLSQCKESFIDILE